MPRVGHPRPAEAGAFGRPAFGLTPRRMVRSGEIRDGPSGTWLDVREEAGAASRAPTRNGGFADHPTSTDGCPKVDAVASPLRLARSRPFGRASRTAARGRTPGALRLTPAVRSRFRARGPGPSKMPDAMNPSQDPDGAAMLVANALPVVDARLPAGSRRQAGAGAAPRTARRRTPGPEASHAVDRHVPDRGLDEEPEPDDTAPHG